MAERRRGVPAGLRAARERARRASGRLEMGDRVARTLGSPALFSVGSLAIGASIYFSLGIVARDALCLTPIVFLLAAAFFVATLMTYVEGASLHLEQGGSSNLARYAFNELVSFVAGWAIVLDYLIVLAAGALSIAHYLSAFWAEAARPGVEVLFAALAIAWVVRANVRGVSGHVLGGPALRIVLLNTFLLIAIIVVGLATAFEPSRIVDSIELGRVPTWEGFVFATAVAAVAAIGVEASSGLAGEVVVRRRPLRRYVLAVTGTAFVLFTGVSIVALMSVPVVGGQTALGGRFIDAPLLGVVSAWEPAWLAELFRYAVGAVGALVLVQGLNIVMLGLSRLAYSLATNRQIPTALGRLHQRYSTPVVVIAIAGVAAVALVGAFDLAFLAGLFAYGAMLSFLISHVAVIVMRFRERDFPRPYRIPLNVGVGGVDVPVPAVLGALAALAGWISVLVLHEGARYVGGGWLIAGLLLYLVYRRSQGKPLRKRFTIPAAALQETADIEYGSILVPVFGGPLDDDIVGTAGRLAAEEAQPGEGTPHIEALYVFEIPMALPLDAELDEERLAAGRRALARAKDVGEEYEGVEVATATTRARSTGAAIVEEARRRGVEAIVLAAEEPTRIRGGALLGGRGGARQRFVGDITREVLEKAPCRVIVTAPPAEEPADSPPEDGGSPTGSPAEAAR